MKFFVTGVNGQLGHDVMNAQDQTFRMYIQVQLMALLLQQCLM